MPVLAIKIMLKSGVGPEPIKFQVSGEGPSSDRSFKKYLNNTS
jgi:hypothetical protein